MMPGRDHRDLIIGQVKGICWFVVAINELDKAQRFSQHIHASLGPVELNPGNTPDYDFTAGSAHQQVKRTAAPLVEWNVLVWAEILQVREDLQFNSHGRSPDCRYNGTTLFRI